MTILPIKLTDDDTVIPLSRIAVIALEASSLGVTGNSAEFNVLDSQTGAPAGIARRDVRIDLSEVEAGQSGGRPCGGSGR